MTTAALEIIPSLCLVLALEGVECLTIGDRR
jgi:hypothetical protein